MVAVMKVEYKWDNSHKVSEMDYVALVELLQLRSAAYIPDAGFTAADAAKLANANTAALARLIEMLAERGVLTLEEGLEVVDSGVNEISVVDESEG